MSGSSGRKAPWDEEAPPKPRLYDAGFGAGFWDRHRGLLDPPAGIDPFSGNEEFQQGYLDGWHYGNARATEKARPPRPFNPMA